MLPFPPSCRQGGLLIQGSAIQEHHSSKAPQKLDEETTVQVVVWTQICTLPMAVVLLWYS